MPDPPDGYLDDIFDVLDAHQHPCIVMGRAALLWMGARVLLSSYFDLLIRHSQVSAIAEDILRSRNWEEAPLVPTYGEDYLQPPPRIFMRMDGTFSIKLWSEEAVRLLVDPPAQERVSNAHFLIEAPCCEVLSSVLLESDMHPGPEISADKPSLLTTPNVCFLPRTHIRSQSAGREPQSKVYIPIISRYLDALLAQRRWLEENERHALSVSGPSQDVGYLIRYLFLEMPSQRRKILPLLESESKSKMVEILDQYKRTYKPRYRRVKLAEKEGGGVVLERMQHGGEWEIFV